jgi:hypothetical protein
MQFDAVEYAVEAGEAVFGVLESDAAHDAMDFVTFFEEELGQIGTVLTGDSGDERAALTH